MGDGKPRHLYLLRKRGGKVRKVASVKIPFAHQREQTLHRRFAPSRYESVKDIPWHQNLQGVYKIGIATNLSSRLATINKDISSGKTEWFAFNWLEALCVRYWFFVYAVSYRLPVAVAGAVVVFLLLKYATL